MYPKVREQGGNNMNRNYNNEACFNGGIQDYVDSNGIEFVGS